MIDPSALARMHHPEIPRQWSVGLLAGIVGVCPVTELEFRYSARALSDYESW